MKPLKLTFNYNPQTESKEFKKILDRLISEGWSCVFNDIVGYCKNGKPDSIKVIFERNLNPIQCNWNTNQKDKNIIYEFWYNECIYESAPFCISLHYTKKGAEKALKQHKEQVRKEFDELYKGEKVDYTFDSTSAWGIVKIEILK